MYQTSTATMMAARTQPTMIGVVSSSLPSSLDGVAVVSRPSVVVPESKENVFEEISKIIAEFVSGVRTNKSLT